MERYETVKKLATGSYGIVYLCRDKEQGATVAVKVLKSAVREAALLQLCKGQPHVVQIQQAYRSESGRVYIVLEYIPHVLTTLIASHADTGGMPQGLVWKLTHQLLLAIRFLHKQQIIHRDLKPSNLMLTEDDVLKVIDLGLARQCRPHQDQLTDYVQTRWYRPPELLVGAPYGFEVDIWAIGCIVAEMVIGAPLFPGSSHLDQLQLAISCFGTLPRRFMSTCNELSAAGKLTIPKEGEVKGLASRLSKKVPKDVLDFVVACLQPDPLKRPTAEELLRLPQFSGQAAASVPVRAFPTATAGSRHAAAEPPAAPASLAIATPASSAGSSERLSAASDGRLQQYGAPSAASQVQVRVLSQQLPLQLQQPLQEARLSAEAGFSRQKPLPPSRGGGGGVGAAVSVEPDVPAGPARASSVQRPSHARESLGTPSGHRAPQQPQPSLSLPRRAALRSGGNDSEARLSSGSDESDPYDHRSRGTPGAPIPMAAARRAHLDHPGTAGATGSGTSAFASTALPFSSTPHFVPSEEVALSAARLALQGHLRHAHSNSLDNSSRGGEAMGAAGSLGKAPASRLSFNGTQLLPRTSLGKAEVQLYSSQRQTSMPVVNIARRSEELGTRRSEEAPSGSPSWKGRFGRTASRLSGSVMSSTGCFPASSISTGSVSLKGIAAASLSPGRAPPGGTAADSRPLRTQVQRSLTTGGSGRGGGGHESSGCSESLGRSEDDDDDDESDFGRGFQARSPSVCAAASGAGASSRGGSQVHFESKSPRRPGSVSSSGAAGRPHASNQRV